MEKYVNIILLFFMYASAGWCMEVFLKYRQYHRFINRGFLTGPICPIYGCGAVLITVLVGSLASVESGVVMTFAGKETTVKKVLPHLVRQHLFKFHAGSRSVISGSCPGI